MSTIKLPDRIDTERLVLRRWRPADAPLLKAAVDASLTHLRPWTPWAVAEPTPLPGVEPPRAREPNTGPAAGVCSPRAVSCRRSSLSVGIKRVRGPRG